MPLYCVAVPLFAAADDAWIERLRARHDPAHQALIGPHVTLLFGIESLDAKALQHHVTERLDGIGPFEIVLRRAAACADPLSDQALLYLLPQEGRDALLTLHRRLWSGPLAASQREDIPYAPHVTVGRFERLADCEAEAAAINANGLALPGRIETLAIVRAQGGQVDTQSTIPLGTAYRSGGIE